MPGMMKKSPTSKPKVGYGKDGFKPEAKATVKPKPKAADTRKIINKTKPLFTDKPKAADTRKIINKTKPLFTAKPKPKATLGPLPKNPTLNDYLARGLKVPKAPGQKKLPSDADVILKGYNDKKTISKAKKK